MSEDETSSSEPAGFARAASASDPAAGGDEEKLFFSPADRFSIRATDSPEPERRRLLEAALAADPKHVQARVQHAEYAESSEAKRALLRDAAEDAEEAFQEAERSLDPLRRARARFDLVVARTRLGYSEWLAGELYPAKHLFETALELDPKDRLRARNGLLACFLELRWFDQAVVLMERYPDHSALHRFAHVLKALAERPAAPSTQKLLELAVEQHPLAGELLVLNDGERLRRVDELLAEIDASQPDPKAAAAEKRELTDVEQAASLLYGAWREVPGALQRLAQIVVKPSEPLPPSLRPRPDLPSVRSDAWKTQLLAVPQAAAEVWRIEVRRVDCWLPQGEKLVRGWLVAVWSYADEDFRGFLLQGGEPSAEQILSVLTEAALDPRGKGAPQPGRPAAVEFSAYPGLEGIVEDLRSLGIARTPEDGPLPPAGNALIVDALRKAPIERPPALAAVEGVSREERRSYYQAALAVAKQAVWRKMLRDEVLEVVKVGLGQSWNWTVGIQGGGGFTPAVMMVGAPETLPVQQAAPARPNERLAVDFVAPSSLAVSDYDEIVEVHALPFPIDLWPKAAVYGLLEDPLPLSPLDVEAAAVCLRAAAAFADKAGAARRRRFKVQVEYGGRTIEADVRPPGAK